MGAQIIYATQHRAVVIGLEKNKNCAVLTMSSPDIRAGVCSAYRCLKCEKEKV